MPIIQFNLLEGRTVEQKRRLAQRVTETVVEVLGVKPENVRILIHEMGGEDFSVGGVTAAQNGKMPTPAAVNGVNGQLHREATAS
ncbi:2-hydroxymuconate tautomerase [Nevskia ramosa]|uniref:2-hydroxymuconate tautomerase n=1 Tax=Nevskia ramosa TaxID=64002 RepID=UPI0003B3A4BB|nr:2-hydroxymuconate tautomerase [Nevskia ramosa]